jgi:hypothetical protein
VTTTAKATGREPIHRWVHDPCCLAREAMGRAPASVSRDGATHGGRNRAICSGGETRSPIAASGQPLPASEAARAITLEIAVVAQAWLNGEPRLMNEIEISAEPCA